MLGLFIVLPMVAGWGLGRVAAMTIEDDRSREVRARDEPAPDALAPVAPAPPPATSSAPVRFTVWDVVLEAPTPISAWQIRAAPRDHSVRLVGIEGGSPPFADPAAYDPAALAGGVVILAAYTLEPPARLPEGALTVATLHVRERGEAGAPPFAVTLEVASDPDGNAIDPVVELRERISSPPPVPAR